MRNRTGVSRLLSPLHQIEGLPSSALYHGLHPLIGGLRSPHFRPLLHHTPAQLPSDPTFLLQTGLLRLELLPPDRIVVVLVQVGKVRRVLLLERLW
jgi:hypothetical protein